MGGIDAASSSGFTGLLRPISREYSKGWNFYFPIPYTRHCKATSDNGKFHYHVGYRTYDAGAKIESFHLDQLKAMADPIENVVVDQLLSPRAVGKAVGSILSQILRTH